MKRRVELVVVVAVLAVVLMLAGVAEAKPLAKVCNVSLEMVDLPPSNAIVQPMVFLADWDVRHWRQRNQANAPDYIQIRLIVDGKVIRDHRVDGLQGCINSHWAYKVAALPAGTRVTFAARAVTGRRVQRWQTATVVVPVRW